MQDVILIDVPEGAGGFEISVQDDGIPSLTYWYKDNLDPTVKCLPPGSWTIVEQTEEGAEKIMGKFMNGEGSYYYFYPGSERFAHAITALHSWIRSQGKEPDEVVIVKKK
jgi:hypothetical protein